MGRWVATEPKHPDILSTFEGEGISGMPIEGLVDKGGSLWKSTARESRTPAPANSSTQLPNSHMRLITRPIISNPAKCCAGPDDEIILPNNRPAYVPGKGFFLPITRLTDGHSPLDKLDQPKL